MPILDVEVVVTREAELPPGLAAAVADAAGLVLGSAPGRTWVRCRTLAREHYAENGGGPPGDVMPVFVTLLLADPPEGDALAALMASLAQAIGETCARPAENVHILVEPPAAGRVAFGGRLVRRS